MNPDYGCYYCVGVLLTDAQLCPTSGRTCLASIRVRGVANAARFVPFERLTYNRNQARGTIENDVRVSSWA